MKEVVFKTNQSYSLFLIAPLEAFKLKNIMPVCVCVGGGVYMVLGLDSVPIICTWGTNIDYVNRTCHSSN